MGLVAYSIGSPAPGAGSLPAVASSQRRGGLRLPIHVDTAKPEQDVIAYIPTLAYVERIAQLEGVQLQGHILHAHRKGAAACFTAEADFDEMTIAWCTRHGSPDRRSALHEIAHLIADDYHTVYWATVVHELADRYLSSAEAARLKREIAHGYPAGHSTYLRATGKRLRRWR